MSRLISHHFYKCQDNLLTFLLHHFLFYLFPFWKRKRWQLRPGWCVLAQRQPQVVPRCSCPQHATCREDSGLCKVRTWPGLAEQLSGCCRLHPQGFTLKDIGSRTKQLVRAFKLVIPKCFWKHFPPGHFGTTFQTWWLWSPPGACGIQTLCLCPPSPHFITSNSRELTPWSRILAFPPGISWHVYSWASFTFLLKCCFLAINTLPPNHTPQQIMSRSPSVLTVHCDSS